MSERKHDFVHRRHDVFLWAGGMVFILALSGAIFGLGHLKGWDADSGYSHNSSNSSIDRFLPEPFIEEPGVKGRYGVGATTRWYYWKLPPNKATAYTRLFVWLSYCLHQISVWVVTFLAQYKQTTKRSTDKYTGSVNIYNYFLLGLNAFFHLLHLLQTHLTYDALAQDTTVASSQASVIMLVIFILLMELKERGVVFGWPSVYDNGKYSRKLRPNYGPTNIIRRYHGYAFSWAVIYTFWYHPMENTWGHVMGFILTWMVMLQGSLVYTKFHVNKYWRLFVEVFVTIHGTIVAVQTAGPDMLGTRVWPMFSFGFLMMVVLNQVFLLPFWRKIHFGFRFSLFFIYLAIVIYMYSWIPDQNGRTWVRMSEIIRIPGVYYLFLIYGWILLFVFLKIESKISTEGEKNQDRIFRKSIYITLSVLIYIFFVVISVLAEYYDVQVDTIVSMIVFVAIFKTGSCISIMALKQVFPKFRSKQKLPDNSYNVSGDNVEDNNTTDYQTFDARL